MRSSDWSSDVCSSDLEVDPPEISSIQACSAASVASTTSYPPSTAWATTAATAREVSVKLWGTLETRLAPWPRWVMNRFGKLCTCTQCRVRLPSAQYCDRHIGSGSRRGRWCEYG